MGKVIKYDYVALTECEKRHVCSQSSNEHETGWHSYVSSPQSLGQDISANAIHMLGYDVHGARGYSMFSFSLNKSEVLCHGKLNSHSYSLS